MPDTTHTTHTKRRHVTHHTHQEMHVVSHKHMFMSYLITICSSHNHMFINLQLPVRYICSESSYLALTESAALASWTGDTRTDDRMDSPR